MILLFLGTWRSTLVVATSIPLSILCSIIILGALGQTINIMTLGGLALAVGILVDDATVEIENIHRNLAMGKPMVRAILDGAQQIAVPAFVSTLCICIVFVPVFFLSGVAKYLFMPLAMAVVFAMLASYLLSRTVVPTMVKFLLKEHLDEVHHEGEQVKRPPGSSDFSTGFTQRFEAGFEKLRDRLHRRARTGCSSTSGVRFSCMGILLRGLRAAWCPSWGAISSRRSMPGSSASTSARPRDAARSDGAAVLRCRAVDPAGGARPEIHTMLDNIGLPVSGINLAFSDNSTIGECDGEILVSLNPNHHPDGRLRARAPDPAEDGFPDMEFFFGAADIVSQILNFGLPAPIDVQVVGPTRRAEDYEIATEIAARGRAQCPARWTCTSSRSSH